MFSIETTAMFPKFCLFIILFSGASAPTIFVTQTLLTCSLEVRQHRLCLTSSSVLTHFYGG